MDGESAQTSSAAEALDLDHEVGVGVPAPVLKGAEMQCTLLRGVHGYYFLCTDCSKEQQFPVEVWGYPLPEQYFLASPLSSAAPLLSSCFHGYRRSSSTYPLAPSHMFPAASSSQDQVH